MRSELPPSIWQLQPTFHVLHHFIDLRDPSAAVRTCNIGTFPTLAAARTAALTTLDKTLKQREKAGFHGKVFKDIDLRLRGLITSVGGNGLEMPLNEFEIRMEMVLREPVGLDGGDEEAALFEEPGTKPTIRLPAKSAMRCRSASMGQVRKRPQHARTLQAEAHPEWTQSRLPYFRKRDEGPFRRADEQPYQATFDLLRPTQKSQGLHNPQIVVQQADELNKAEQNRTTFSAYKFEPRLTLLGNETTGMKGGNMWATKTRGMYQLNTLARKPWQRYTDIRNGA